MKRIFLVIAILLVTSCSQPTNQTSVPAGPPTATTETANRPTQARVWWRDAVFYEIFVRSFYDSNGDGIGDFNGIASKLDYLKSLGINGIWLMPIQPSPSYHGYDVLDYYDVNPQYGSLDDFKNLLKEAHSRDIHIIIDLVINHTSSKHPWFLDANSSPDSKYRNWYVWSDKAESKRWYEGSTGFYYAYFEKGMPDLNYRDPDVTNEIEKISVFWLDTVGVDGFRVDAAKHLIEDGATLENTEETHDWFTHFYKFYKSKKPDAYAVGEVSNAGGFVAKTYIGQLDQIFNFELAGAILKSVQEGSASSLTSTYKFTTKSVPDGNFATFLTNHDQNRAMSVFNGDLAKAKLAAFLLLTGPGTPFIYYGEEIGQQGRKPDQDIRLPMQWDDNLQNAGFSIGNPWRKPSPETQTMNVVFEEKDPASLLNYYKNLIVIRSQHHALQTGSTTILTTNNKAIFATLRSEGAEYIFTVTNLSGKPVSDYELGAQEIGMPAGTYSAKQLLGDGSLAQFNINNDELKSFKPFAELQPYSAYIFEIVK